MPVFIKNVKDIPITLSFNTSAWQPLNAEQYLTFDWNYTGAILTTKKVIPVLLQLQVNIAIEGISNFSFDITIIGTEVE